uniref:Proepiregulin-like n=1 Tax=Nothobranchius furzeri TaxID=105023 RepID=A0A8C6P4R3_NOTFU
MLLWPCAGCSCLECIDDQHAASSGEERPRVTKRSFESCDSTFDHYCLNNGKCMLLLDMNEHHCKYVRFSGSRCEHLNFVVQPLAEGQIIFIVFCVILLTLGLSGALYLCYCWRSSSSTSSPSWILELLSL